jgi:hypothetical protein
MFCDAAHVAQIVRATIAFSFLAVSIVVTRSTYDTTVEARAMGNERVSAHLRRFSRRVSSSLGISSSQSSSLAASNHDEQMPPGDSKQPSLPPGPIVV